MKLEDRPYAQPRFITLRDGRELTIRLIETADLSQVVAFYRDIPANDASYYRGTSAALVASAEEWVTAAATSSCMVCLVLVDEAGVIHGEAWYDWRAKKPGMSTFGICIRPTVQKQGAGRLIMSRLLAIGDTYGPPKMNLTVQMENTRAWKLYTSLGFKPVYDQMCRRWVNRDGKSTMYGNIGVPHFSHITEAVW